MLGGDVDEIISLGTAVALEARAWRGNVRELKNLNQRLVLMRSGDRITRADLDRLVPAAGEVLFPGCVLRVEKLESNQLKGSKR